MAEKKVYNKLIQVEEYDLEAAQQLAEALTEIAELQARISELTDLAQENKHLHGHIWGTADGKFYAHIDIEDGHLVNIMNFCLEKGRTIPKGIKAEARKRGMTVPTTARSVSRSRQEVAYLPAADDLDDKIYPGDAPF